MISPSDLDGLLRCPLCRATLQQPATLHCGHSVCDHHLRLPSSSCPVPECSTSSNAPQGPHIPEGSRVRFTAAPQQPNVVVTPIAEHATDVTLSNVISLVRRTGDRLRSVAPHRRPDDDDADDDDDRENRSDPNDRPRKRHKRYHNESDEEEEETPLLQHLISAATRDRLVPQDEPLIPDNNSILAEFDKKLLEELTCHICYVLYYQPVTTPCQHTYCAKCLQRSIDHSTSCPVCRQELPINYFHDQPINKTILSIILKAYPQAYQERQTAFEEEERHSRLDTPVFVATLSFPGVPTFLHLFEPRYRLMLRRCLESTNPRFGMIMPPKPGIHATYGTMLEIRSVQMLADGRSMVETYGSTRFRIIERGTLDGYMVAKIESIYDYPDDITETLVIEDDPVPTTPPVSSPSSQPLLRRIRSTLTGSSHSVSSNSLTPNSTRASSSASPRNTSASPPVPPERPRTNEELMATCRLFLERLQRGAAPWVVQRLSSTYGAMPSDPALFSFWVALILPIEDAEKAKLLPLRSARLRLQLVVYWIERLNNNWYAWVYLAFVKLNGWVVDPASPVLPCLLWIAVVLMVSRFIGWI